MKSTTLTLLSFSLLTSTSALAQTGKPFPSHCKAQEHAYLNAKMSAVINQPGGGYSLAPKNGKILSICADKAKEPFTRLIYRYGAPGKVELEQQASSKSPFSIAHRRIGQNVAENLIFFTKNGYSYYVVEAAGQGSGISLHVFQGRKQLAELFSGNERGVDFESGLIDLDFERAKSPVLLKKQPAHTF